MRTLLPHRGGLDKARYSPNCFVSRSAMLQERSVQGCKRAKGTSHIVLYSIICIPLALIILNDTKICKYHIDVVKEDENTDIHCS